MLTLLRSNTSDWYWTWDSLSNSMAYYLWPGATLTSRASSCVIWTEPSSG